MADPAQLVLFLAIVLIVGFLGACLSAAMVYVSIARRLEMEQERAAGTAGELARELDVLESAAIGVPAAAATPAAAAAAPAQRRACGACARVRAFFFANVPKP